MPSLGVPMPSEDLNTSVKLWDTQVNTALDCGEEAAKWLREFIFPEGENGKNLKLVFAWE